MRLIIKCIKKPLTEKIKEKQVNVQPLILGSGSFWVKAIDMDSFDRQYS